MPNETCLLNAENLALFLQGVLHGIDDEMVSARGRHDGAVSVRHSRPLNETGLPVDGLEVTFSDGSLFHLTITQVL